MKLYLQYIKQELLTKKTNKMGLSNSSNQKTNYCQMNAKCDETNTPIFKKATKTSSGWDYSQTFDTVSGNLVNISIAEKTIKDVKSNVFRIKFNDGEEFNQVEMSHNNLTYSILNSLMSLMDQDSTMLDLSIKLYRRKDDKGKFWPGAEVNYNGKKMPWKFSMGADSIIPKATPVMVGNQPFIQNGKAVMDTSKVKAFWEEEVKKLAEKVNAKQAMKPNESFNEEQSLEVEDGHDPLPF